MSLKTFNPATNKWEVQASSLATDIKVVDLTGDYEAQNVNGCLKEISTDVKTIKKDIEYLYEHGGNGGGGNGSATPTVTIDGASVRNVKSNETIDIFYYFTSPNQGNGIATLSYGSSSTNVSISQGRNKWTVGPFSKGEYVLTILVQDSQGFWSTAAQITIISGSLELSSSFSDANDFTLLDDILINYNISTLVSEAVFLDYWFNGVKTTVAANIGANQLHIGNLPFMGVSTLKMQARTASFTSNALNYTLVAANSTTLYTSTTFVNNSNIEIGKNLVIDYRVSMRDQYNFNTSYWVDGTKIADVISKPGVNYWNVGNTLSVGSHTFKIVTSTTDGLQTKEINITAVVVAVGYTPWQHVTTNLIGAFNASGKLNNSITKNVWEDSSGHAVPCNLYNFNYSTNGWLENALKLNGKAYAVVDLAPFANGIKYGFTFEIIFKTSCVGNIDAKVISCKNPSTPFQGLEINTWQSKFTTSYSDTIQSQIQDDTWTKVSYVVNRTDKTMTMYINGIISSVTWLSANNPTMVNYLDEFTYNGKIYLGAEMDAAGNIINNSVSEIKSIRIYDRALTDDEIVQNFVADETDREKQLALRALNTSTEGIPVMNIVGNFSDMDEDSERQATITYADPSDPSKNFSKDYCLISWQGTSSRTYPVKNWTIKLKDAGQPWLTYSPKDNWKPEDRWTLKANYMDSSNANNIGLNKFIRDFFKPYPYPCEVTDPTTRPNVDGFTVNLKINGVAAGIYTWNIDRYAPNNYGFVTYSQGANGTTTINRHATAVSYEVAVNSTSGAGAFKNKSWDSIRTEFKHRYNYRETSGSVTETVKINNVDTTVLKTGMHNELVDLVTWVCDCTDEQFLTDLDEHFSVRHLIDYYILAYVLGMVDNLGKNMVLTTWGKNGEGSTIWYPSFYDCDSVLGLNNTGYISFDAGLDMLNGDYNTSNSLLWTKLVKMFGNKISERYNELRLARTVNGASLPPILSYDNIMSYLGDEVIDKVGQKFYNQDARLKYINNDGKSWSFMCNGTRREFTERWLKERFVYMDSVYEFNFNSKAVIRSNIQGLVNLKLKTYSPQWVKVSFTDAADTKVKLQVGKEYWTEFTKMIENGTDNNIEIYGVNNVMYIDGIKNLNPGSINIAQAEKLIELDIAESTRITQLSLGTNKYLTRLVCKNCTNLGYQVTNRTLDVSACTNLKEFDCSNTHIANIKFNEVGGVLERLDASNTDITSFSLAGQEYLPSINLNGCKDLSTLIISTCNGLTDVTMTDTNLGLVAITGCDNLSNLNLSRTKNLTSFNISGCPGLKSLVMAGVSNVGLTELDLSYSPLLESLDISSSSYIQTLTFPAFPLTYSTVKFQMVNGVATIPKKYVVQSGANAPIVKLTESSTALMLNTDYTLATDSAGYTTITRKTTGAIPANQSSVYITYSHNSCLTDLKCDNSAIKALRFGRGSAIPTCLDLNGIPLNSINFYNCANLTEIRNINYIASGSSSPFNNCYNLTSITGTIKLKGTVDRGFYNCRLLATWPTLDLSEVTNCSETFYLCSKMTAAQANTILQSVSSNLTSAWRMLRDCTGITGNFFQNYPNIFSKCTKLSYSREMFYGCTGITGTFPAGLLVPMTALSDAYHMFSSCTGITGEIPNDFLRYNTNLTTTFAMFANTKVNYVNLANLYRYNTKLQSTASTFSGCTQLAVTLNENMFAYTPQLTSVSGMFNGCAQVTGTIPQNIFNNIPLTTSNGITSNQLRSVDYFLSGTNIMGTIPAANASAGVKGLLDNCYYLENCEAMFANTKISDAIPTDLLKFNNNIQRCGSLFHNCTGLNGAIPSTLLKGKTKLISAFRLFYNCTGIQSSIPEGFLDDCVLLTDISEMFSGCTGINGNIPSRVSTWTSSENIPLKNQIVMEVENPMLPSLIVRLSSGQAPLIADVDYTAIVDESKRTVITRMESGAIPAGQIMLHISFMHDIPMSETTAIVPIANIEPNSLVVMASSQNTTPYVLNVDYTVSTNSLGVTTITRTQNSNIPSGQRTLTIDYSRTATMIKTAVIDTLNVDINSVQIKATSAGSLMKRDIDYTSQTNLRTGYIEITMYSGSVSWLQESLIMTFKHVDNNLIERNKILAKSVSPSIISQTENVTKYGLLDNLPNLVTVNNLFYGCKSLASTIPPKFFVSGDKITNGNYCFAGCHYLYGPIPSGLLANCRSLITAAGMFQDCVNLQNTVVAGETTYVLPPNLFESCLNLTNVAYFLCCWSSYLPNAAKINGEIHPNMFRYNMKLQDTSYMFSSSREVTGAVDSTLFKYNTQLNTIKYMFYSTKITSLGSDLFRTATALKNMEYAFQNCSSLAGYVPEFWSTSYPISPTATTQCFNGCSPTLILNWANIPTGWK